jgi:hypothetical protein
MVTITRTLTEEHKRKVGEANSIALKGKHCSPKTEFKKGHKTEWTEEMKEKISKENSYLWKGGISRLTAKKVCIENGRDLTKCQICKEKGKIVIHHCDGNRENNNNFNLGIVCYFCHNAIHDNPNKIATRFQVGHLLNQHGAIAI